MNKIEILGATRQRKFERIANEISKVYNLHTGKNERFSIEFPEDLFAIYPNGVKGGIIVTKIYGFKESATIMVAGFKEKDRGKGYLKACVNAGSERLAKKGLNLVSVTLNPNDDTKVWERLGFTNKVTVGGMLHLSKVPRSEFR
ncbi:hypothetical protein NMT40_003725 [Vibrio cholerae]|uniref:hypothetical protein n=1 Tax=Vibrio vulnificus TaxID=672 RepID=UPI001EEBAB7D|nr:hypothetical protein [Vibrio vulnificus]EJL6984106.1 hypothetical protein [Vibrio cholerae]EKG0006095.1 hypothetical protein [Vibrio cholerae]MCG6289445.1 hypothetical protein [Vibrio vulnificus]MCU8159450.1 hypothetical protein [Vibrio vulnificus]HDY7777296.1 hypothetical protein [Vibrio vulnificus]